MQTLFILGTLLFFILLIFAQVFFLRLLVHKMLSKKIGGWSAFLFLFIWFIASTLLLYITDYFGERYNISYIVLIDFAVQGLLFAILFVYKFKSSFLRGIAAFFMFSIPVALVSAFIIFGVRTYLFEPFIVAGQAMNPTYKTNDYLIIKKFDHSYEPGNIVVYKPTDEHYFVHRIVAGPGQEVRIVDNSVIVDDTTLVEPYAHGTNSWDGAPLILGEDEYFILGDNREHSNDSRNLGAIKTHQIVGPIFTKIDILSDLAWEEETE